MVVVVVVVSDEKRMLELRKGVDDGICSIWDFESKRYIWC